MPRLQRGHKRAYYRYKRPDFPILLALVWWGEGKSVEEIAKESGGYGAETVRIHLDDFALEHERKDRWHKRKDRVCEVQGCQNLHCAKGLCSVHYKQKERRDRRSK